MTASTIRETFPKKLLQYMSEYGKTRNDLVRDLGFKYTTVRDWEKGITVPRMDKVEMLANYFHCTNADLLEEKEKSTAADDGLSKTKQELMDFIRTLPEESVQVLLQVARSIKQ